MNKIDNAKLKCLIKMILINHSPKGLTSKQLANIINKHNWAFQISITSPMIGALMKKELSGGNYHFMDGVSATKQRGGLVYSFSPNGGK